MVLLSFLLRLKIQIKKKNFFFFYIIYQDGEEVPADAGWFILGWIIHCVLAGISCVHNLLSELDIYQALRRLYAGLLGKGYFDSIVLLQLFILNFIYIYLKKIYILFIYFIILFFI